MVDDQANLVDMPLELCEFCNKRFREGEMTPHGDILLCPKCSAEWTAEYDACEHDWEQGPFDPARVCKKCNGTDNRQLGETEED